MKVHGYTVGPVAENCFFAARDGETAAIVIDPGEEAERLIEALDDLGLVARVDHDRLVAPVETGDVAVLLDRSDREAADVHRRQRLALALRGGIGRPALRIRRSQKKRSTR